MALTSFAEIALLLREHPQTFQQSTLQRLEAERSRSLTPRQAHAAGPFDSLADAAAWTLEHTPQPAAGHRPVLSTEASARLGLLGRAQRRFGYPPQAYQGFAECLRAGLKAVIREAGEYYCLAVAQAEDALEAACARMAKAAIADADAGEPAAYAGTVVDVARPARRISVVTVDTGLPIRCQAGDRLPVTSPLAPGRWVPLAPAAPTGGLSQTQFHLDLSEGAQTRDLGRARPGDRWTLGRPERGLRANPHRRRVAMIAHTTGWSALRAVLLDMVQWERHPEVTVFLHAEFPGELYDAAQLGALAQATSWLRLVASASHDSDPWWVGAAAPAELPIRHAREPAELAAQLLGGQGGLRGCQVLVAGMGKPARRSAERVRELGAEEVCVEDFGPLFDWG